MCLAGDAIVRSDMDMQVMLLSNMILTGGTACIDGLSERLKTEGKNALPLFVFLRFVSQLSALQFSSIENLSEQ